IKAPFALAVGLSLGGDARPADTSSAAAPPPTVTARASEPKSGPPQIAPGPNDGAASVDAVVKQMQTAATAGKARDLLAVIYPDDRTKFGQIMATMITFSVLAHMD